MANPEHFPRKFSSCRGVAFEIKPHADPFAIKHQVDEPPPLSRRFNLAWESISRIFPTTSVTLRSASRASSHFCDLDDDEEEDEDEKDNTLPDIEKGHDLETKKLPLPRTRSVAAAKVHKRKHARLSVILLDQGLFTVYKRLFVVCLTLNITALVLAATGHFSYARNRPALFGIGNILALMVCRSEVILRVLFWLAVKLFGYPWVRLGLKTAVTAFLQSVGGIHSSCGVSSVAWLVYALVLTLKNRDNTTNEIIIVASTVLGLLVFSCMAAFPLVRHLHHNFFERVHRFAGWASLGLVWAFITLTIMYDPKTKSYKDASQLFRRQEFYLTVVITILTVLPWTTVRKVPVRISAPSDHASLIKFEGGIKAGILGRISPSPLSEWHAFGIISDGKKEHMMLAGAVGDYTKTLVSNPPTHLWIRSFHFAGLPYLVNMYDRILVVATGSGICVFLSFLLQPCSANVCFVWVTKGVEQNFGKEIKEMVSGFPKDKVIVHDTEILGRPNVAQMSIDAARNWRAEVVFVTSNPEGSKVVLDACNAVGIPAFSPVWDS